MFNVIRTPPDPNYSTNYYTTAAVTALEKMFHGKCYLCEDKVSDPVIEHFIPHGGDHVKKYNWKNLYYACPRCNNIKGTITNILDCCNPGIDVSLSIKCLCPSIPGHDIVVEAQCSDSKTQNTANLLYECYNNNDTGIRGISREMLHEKIFDYYCKFITNRRILRNQDSLQSDKNKAKEHLMLMRDVSYPFSVFWKWHVLSDKFLENYSE
jgi:hypothetical protein